MLPSSRVVKVTPFTSIEPEAAMTPITKTQATQRGPKHLQQKEKQLPVLALDARERYTYNHAVAFDIGNVCKGSQKLCKRNF